MLPERTMIQSHDGFLDIEKKIRSWLDIISMVNAVNRTPLVQQLLECTLTLTNLASKLGYQEITETPGEIIMDAIKANLLLIYKLKCNMYQRSILKENEDSVKIANQKQKQSKHKLNQSIIKKNH